jgi:membrane protein YdbS with pleckstrin-like domain
MSFPRRLLRPGEEVVLDVRPQGWVLVPRGLLALLVLAGAVAAQVAGVSSFAAWALVVLLAVSLGWLVIGYLRWITTSFVLTTDRLVHRSGILSRHSREIPLEHLSDISYRQRLLERVVGIGDLVLESAGRDSTETFVGLPRPARIQREIHRQLELGRLRAAAGAGGGSGYPVLTIPEQIEQLAGLARRGVLTDAEFQAKKAELLDRL